MPPSRTDLSNSAMDPDERLSIIEVGAKQLLVDVKLLQERLALIGPRIGAIAPPPRFQRRHTTKAPRRTTRRIRRGSKEESDLTLRKQSTSLLTEIQLLRPPPAVQYWLNGGCRMNAWGKRQYDLGQEATDWLIAVVRAAHKSAKLKANGRALMSCANYTTNLAYLNCWDHLTGALRETLVALAAEANQINQAQSLASSLTTEKILKGEFRKGKKKYIFCITRPSVQTCRSQRALRLGTCTSLSLRALPGVWLLGI